MENIKTSDIRVFVSAVIRNARLVSRCSLNEMSCRLNIDPMTLFNYEVGHQPVPCNLIARMIAEYKIPEYLFFKRLMYLSLQMKNDSF